MWIGQERTNNEAEYSGLIEGLRAAKELGIKVSFVLRDGGSLSGEVVRGIALPERRLAKGLLCPLQSMSRRFVSFAGWQDGVCSPCCLVMQYISADFAVRGAGNVSSFADVSAVQASLRPPSSTRSGSDKVPKSVRLVADCS